MRPGIVPQRWLDPNPVFARELSTTVRAPSFLAVVFLSSAAIAAVVLFAITSLGTDRLPAEAGRTLIEWYFGACTVLVALVSSVWAAGAVARDADAGVLEALAVAGYSPWRTLGGKLVALWTVSCLLIAAASPAALVPLIVGGTMPGTVLAGHMLLALIALWSIAFGLAVSTRLGATRSSTIVAVAVALPGSVALLAALWYLGHWAQVHWEIDSEGPFWPANALAWGVGPQRLVFLVVLPLLTTAGALWYLAATAVGPLLPPGEDAGRGVRLWIPVASTLLVVTAALGRAVLEVTAGRDFVLAAIGAELGLVAIATLTIAGEPARGRRGAGLLGPGLTNASFLVASSGLAATIALVALLHLQGTSPWPPEKSFIGVVALSMWVLCVPAVGHGLRSALHSSAVARVVLGAGLLALGATLPPTSIGDAAPWSPWSVLRDLPEAPEWSAIVPAIVLSCALAVSAALAVVRRAGDGVAARGTQTR